MPNTKEHSAKTDLSALYLVALTGNIGSGKSSAAKVFEELGAVIVDADILARNAVVKGSQALAAIEAQFGAEYISASGDLDRKKLGKLIFSDQQARQKLEAITHPAIRKLFFTRLDELNTEALRLQKKTIVIYVVPLYFESGINYKEIQKVIVVYAAMEICINRIIERDQVSAAEAKQKYNSQLAIELKKEKADFVVDNSGSLDELKRNCQVIYENILHLGKI